MTELSKGLQTLPLLDSPNSIGAWLIALAFGIPFVVLAGCFWYAWSRKGPALPLMLSGAFGLAVTVGVTFWIWHMIRSAAVTIDANTLTVDSGIETRRFPIASLRANGVRSVALPAHPELNPSLRTYGIGMPGFASGWFRLVNGEKAFCIITDSNRVAVLKADDGTWILLSLADTSALRSALAER